MRNEKDKNRGACPNCGETDRNVGGTFFGDDERMYAAATCPGCEGDCGFIEIEADY